jgi:protease secretion system membrane fusion protein
MMSKLFGNKSHVTEVMSKDISAQPVNTDATVHTRLGWFVVLAGVGGFFLWALFAPLDQGVPVQGSVAVATNRKTVQHQSGGTIESILVKDGDVVKAGQPLIKMNEVVAKSAADITRSQYYSARAVEARLIAERDGKASVEFPPELSKIKDDPRVASAVSLQSQLFSSRRSALQSELGAVDENIAGLRAQIRGLEESRESQKQQLNFLKEQLDGVRDLAKEGYIPRNRLLDLERTYAQVNGGLSENVGNIGRAQRQISELSLRRMQRQQEVQKEVRTQLTDVQKEADALNSRLIAQDFELANVLVRAPVDGTVVGLNVFTNGGVVPPGARLMDLVPTDDPLVVEGMVPVNLIDKVHPDLKVEFLFSAFNQNKTPHIPGVVTRVSADKLVDEKTGQPYYKMSAKVTPEGVKLLKDHQVRPGMPVELFIKTGERTMMNYLLKPIMDRANTSMTEE